jgi:hypothetical protein
MPDRRGIPSLLSPEYLLCADPVKDQKQANMLEKSTRHEENEPRPLLPKPPLAKPKLESPALMITLPATQPFEIVVAEKDTHS